MNAFESKLLRVAENKGFIAALDQSGGSTPKALKNYGEPSFSERNIGQGGSASLSETTLCWEDIPRLCIESSKNKMSGKYLRLKVEMGKATLRGYQDRLEVNLMNYSGVKNVDLALSEINAQIERDNKKKAASDTGELVL